MKQVKDILDPVDRWTATACPSPPSCRTWTASSSWALPLTRSAASPSPFPPGTQTKCIQCNNCAYVCPHATIRPYALTEEEAKNAPAAAKIVDIKAGKGKGVYKYTMAISPLDCMGCGVCVGQCPVGALTMVPQERQARPAGGLRLLRRQGRRPRPTCRTTPSRAASSSSPCWSSPAPAPAAPRPAMPAWSPSSSATVCTSPTPPAAPPSGAVPAATSPYCTNKDGHGPAWCQLPVRG